jgi:hypothetical protein
MSDVVDRLNTLRATILINRRHAQQVLDTSRLYERQIESRGRVKAYTVVLGHIDRILGVTSEA